MTLDLCVFVLYRFASPSRTFGCCWVLWVQWHPSCNLSHSVHHFWGHQCSWSLHEPDWYCSSVRIFWYHRLFILIYFTFLIEKWSNSKSLLTFSTINKIFHAVFIVNNDLYFCFLNIPCNQVCRHLAWDHQHFWHCPRSDCTNCSGSTCQRCELLLHKCLTIFWLAYNTPSCYKLLSLHMLFLLEAFSDGLEEGLPFVSRSKCIRSLILHTVWHWKNPTLGIKGEPDRNQRERKKALSITFQIIYLYTPKILMTYYFMILI